MADQETKIDVYKNKLKELGQSVNLKNNITAFWKYLKTINGKINVYFDRWKMMKTKMTSQIMKYRRNNLPLSISVFQTCSPGFTNYCIRWRKISHRPIIHTLLNEMYYSWKKITILIGNISKQNIIAVWVITRGTFFVILHLYGIFFILRDRTIAFNYAYSYFISVLVTFDIFVEITYLWNFVSYTNFYRYKYSKFL